MATTCTKIKSSLRIFIGLLALPTAVVLAIFFLEKKEFFLIQEVKIEIVNSSSFNSDYLDPQIKKLSEELEHYKSSSLIRIDLEKVSESVLRQDWISDHQLYRRLPNVLVVQVEAFEIPFLYLNKSGKLFPVNAKGELLAQLNVNHSPDTIILTGELLGKKLDIRQKAIQLIEEIPQKGAFSQKTISELMYDLHDGFWTTLIRSGIQVKLGEDQFSVKASRVSQVLDYLEKNQIKARVIDANLSKKVLVRLRRGP